MMHGPLFFSGGNRLLQLFEQGDLRGVDNSPGGGQREPTAFIDLGVGLLPPGVARPFYLERITDDGGGVEVAGERPGKDTLASFLPDGAQGLEMSFEGEAGFFAEFADGGVQRGFFIFKFTFGYGPGAGVFVFPEGAAGVDEKDFKGAGGPPIKEDAGRLSTGHVKVCFAGQPRRTK